MELVDLMIYNSILKIEKDVNDQFPLKSFEEITFSEGTYKIDYIINLLTKLNINKRQRMKRLQITL